LPSGFFLKKKPPCTTSKTPHLQEKCSNARYYHLIKIFRDLTGVPMALNSSFRAYPVDTQDRSGAAESANGAEAL